MFKKLSRLICIFMVLLVVVASIPSASVSATEKDPFYMGVCAHPDGMEYTKNFDDVPYYIAKMGGNIVRIDLSGYSKDTVKKWDTFFAQCKAYNLEIMGIVYNTDDAKLFSQRYGHQIKYMQILNEQDLQSLISGDGSNKSQYNINQIAQIVANMKDIGAVLRQYSPNTKLVINYTYLHYGFIDHLVEQEVDFDIVGFDWYSNMDVYSLEDVLDEIKNRYGKPIFICEANIWTHPDGSQDAEMGAQIIKYYDIFKSRQESHNILGYTIYELYDEPTKSGGEAEFGIIKMNPDFTLGGPKSAYYQVQEHLGFKDKNIAKIPNSSLDLSGYKTPAENNNVSSKPATPNEEDYDTEDVPTQTVPGEAIVKTVTRNEEITTTVYEEPETVQTVKTKHIYQTPGFPLWLIIELAVCAAAVVGFAAFMIIRAKKKKRQ